MPRRKIRWWEAVEAARRAGARTLRIESDSHAAGFYVVAGAMKVGEAPSRPVPGRMLPVFEVSL